MNENFNGLNETNSLNNNEISNQSNLEPVIINNTESAIENINPNPVNIMPENNVNGVSEPSVAATMENVNNDSNMGMNSTENVYPTPQNIGMSEVQGNSVSPNGSNKKKTLTTILIIVLVVALGAVGALFAYKYVVMSNPVTIIEKSLTSLGKETEKKIEQYNSELNKILNGKMQNEISVEFNEYAGNVVLKSDLKNKIIGLNVDAKQDGEELLNVEAVLKENAGYLKLLEDSTNNFMYEYDFSEVFNVTEDIEEIDPVLSKFATYLGESVKEKLTKDDFEKSKEEISYNGKQVNATKYTLTFNAENINPILDAYKNKLSNDDKLISYLAELSGESNDGIKITISEMIEGMKLDENDEEEEVKLFIYVKGAELVKVDFGVDNDNKFEFYFNDYIEFNFLSEGKKVLTAKLAEDEFKMNIETPEDSIIVDFADGKYKIDINLDDESVIVDGTYNITDTSMELTFNTEIMDEKYTGKVSFKETISDSIKINVPTNALNVEDEDNYETFMQEVEEMPIYPYIEEYVNPDYGYEDNYYYDDEDEYYFDQDEVIWGPDLEEDSDDTSLDYDDEWDF